MKNQTYPIKGMHCASCASIIEKTLKKTEGVRSVEVNYGTEAAKVSFDESIVSPQDLSKKIEPLGYSLSVVTANEMGMSADEHAAHLGLNQSKNEKLAEIKDMKTKIISVIPLAIVSIFVMGWEILAQYQVVPEMSRVVEEFFHHLLPLFATYTLFVVGKPYLLGFYRFLRHGKANMDTLIGMGTLTAFVYSFIVSAFEESLGSVINVSHTYYDVTIVVIAFIALGKYLEARSKIKTGDAIEKLLNKDHTLVKPLRFGKDAKFEEERKKYLATHATQAAHDVENEGDASDESQNHFYFNHHSQVSAAKLSKCCCFRDWIKGKTK